MFITFIFLFFLTIPIETTWSMLGVLAYKVYKLAPPGSFKAETQDMT